MKKTLLTIMATVCVMAVVCGAYIAGVKQRYEAELEATKQECSERITTIYKDKLELMYDCNDLKTELSDLEDQVYNVMEGNSNKMVFVKDGAKYIYNVETNVTSKGVLR